MARQPEIRLRAKVDARGVETFNFPQLVHLYPGVRMQSTSFWSPQLETLAVNLLLHARPAWRSIRTPDQARRLLGNGIAEEFALEFIAPYSGHSWSLPGDTLREFIEAMPARAWRDSRTRSEWNALARKAAK
jgi:hypothetical protein